MEDMEKSDFIGNPCEIRAEAKLWIRRRQWSRSQGSP
jgi:hypothetical protein